MKLHHKITLLVTIILIAVISSIAALSFFQMRKTLKEQIGRDLMDMASSVASLEVVKDNLGNSNGEVMIQDAIERLRLRTRIQFIVVMNMEGIRYSHPQPFKVGQKFSGGDEIDVLTKGRVYVSEGTGTLGPSLRAFAPVYKDGEQIGAVCIGILTSRVYHEIYTALYKYISVLLVGLVLGVVGAAMLSYNIKRTIFGLEPRQIAYILKEREAVLQGIKEGIVAVGQGSRITLFNQSAAGLLGICSEDIGREISIFIDDEPINAAIYSGEVIRNYECKIKNGNTLMFNYHPLIKDNGEIMGGVASFQDFTEVRSMAEELTGIKKMTDALRAQNHEFMNKLHTISGLIQLEEYDRALDYIDCAVQSREGISTLLTKNIRDVSIAGLLLAKYNKAQELRIELKLDEGSLVGDIPEGMYPEDICSILGNLIENSIDALIDEESREIRVRLLQDSETFEIMVHNNGPEIPDSIIDRVFEQGTTTKEGQRGFGLYIVKKIVDRAGGSISLKNQMGITWGISLPMKRRD